MQLKQKLAYMVVGGLLVAMGQMLNVVLPMVGAQEQSGGESQGDVSFDTVTCNRLVVTDDKGEERIVAGKFPEDKGVKDKKGEPRIETYELRTTGEYGRCSMKPTSLGLYNLAGKCQVDVSLRWGEFPTVALSDSDGTRNVRLQESGGSGHLTLEGHGGMISMLGGGSLSHILVENGVDSTTLRSGSLRLSKDDETQATTGEVDGVPSLRAVELSVEENGGKIIVRGGEKIAIMDVNEHGGRVHVSGKVSAYTSMSLNQLGGVVIAGGDGGSVGFIVSEQGGVVIADGEGGHAELGVNQYGGRVGVFGKGSSDTTRAVIGVNEYGNGAVSTWDKNGYRQ